MAYSKTKTITIDNTKVEGTSDLTDFALLYVVTEADFATTGNGGFVENTLGTMGASGAVTGPTDLIFTSDAAGATQLDHEVVDYDATTGYLYVRIRIPTLTYNSDTVIYCQYGDSGVTTSQENIGGVWETNYKGVWHMMEASGTRYDSSGNNYDFTENATSGNIGTRTGKIDTALDIDTGNAETLSKSDEVALSMGANDYMIIGWFNLDSDAATQAMVAKDAASNREFILQYRTDLSAVRMLTIQTNGNFGFSDTPGTFPTATWKFIVGYWDTTNQETHVKLDNNAISSSGDTGTPNQPYDATANLRVGNSDFGTSPFAGGVEALRIYKGGLLSNDYLNTIYNNENSPATFYATADYLNPSGSDTVGTSEAVSGAVSAPNISTSDSTSLSESVGAQITSAPDEVNVSDSSLITESVLSEVVIDLTVSEAVSVSESAGMAIDSLGIAVSDTVNVIDTPRYYQDLVTVSESVSAIASDPNVSGVQDTPTITENVSLLVYEPDAPRSVYVMDTISLDESVSMSGAGHNSSLWRDITDLYGNTWTVNNDYKNDE